MGSGTTMHLCLPRILGEAAPQRDAARILRASLKVLFINDRAENAAIGNSQLAPDMQLLTKPFVMASLASQVREMIDGQFGHLIERIGFAC